MTDVVLVLNREGRYLGAAPTLAAASERNRQRSDWLTGKTIHEVFADASTADRLVQTIGAALDTGETQHVEYMMDVWGTLTAANYEPPAAAPVSDGSEAMWFAAAVSPMDRDRVVWVARDVTARVQAQQRLERAVRDRTQELTSLLEVSRELSSAVDFRSLAEAILREMKAVIDYSGSSVVMLEGNGIRIVESMGPDGREEDIVGMYLDIDESVPLWVQVMRGEPVLIEDMTADDDPHAQQLRQILGESGGLPAYQYIRSWMCIPLSRESNVIGMLTMSKDEPGFFTTRHAELATAVARQAAVVARNAELFEETRRRAREQGALLEIARALSSTLELDPLLNLILDQLKNVVPYDGASVDLVVDDEVKQLAVRRPAGYPVTTTGNPVPVRVSTLHPGFQPALRGEPVYVRDVFDDSDAARGYRESWGGDLKGTTAEWVRSYLIVPMFARDRLVGVLSTGHSQAGFFTDEHIRIVQSVASQAAAAVDNARLYEQIQHRVRESRALLETAKAIASTLELQPLLDVVLDELRTVIPYDGAGVSLLEEDYFSQIAVRRPAGESTVVGHRFKIDAARELMAKTLAGETVAIDDIQADTKDAEGFRSAWGGPLKGSAIGYVRSWLGVPLMSRDRVIGMLTIVKSQPGFFTAEHMAIGQTFAGHTAAAIENARLYEEARRHAGEQGALLEVSRAVVSTLDPREMMGVILDKLDQIVEHTGSAFVMREGDNLVVLDARSIAGAEDEVGVRVAIPAAGRIWQTVSGGREVIIDDLNEETADAQALREALGAYRLQDLRPIRGIRSWMAVPLAAKDAVIGMLTVSSGEPARFNVQHARLVRAVADQAALAFENARLFEETRQRAKETHALLDVSRAVASTLDAQKVLSVIVEQLGSVTEHTGASILLIRDDALEFVEARSITASKARIGARIPFEVAPSLTAAMLQGETVIIDDVRADDPMAADYRAAIDSIGLRDHAPFNVIRSWMAVPLALQDRVLGLLTISWTEPSHFTAAHARLARAFADQASVAMENARLYEQARSRARETEALLEVSQAVVSTLDLGDLMRSILDKAGEIVERTGTAIVTLDGQDLVIWDATTGEGAAAAQIGARVPLTIAAPLWEPITRGEPVIVSDIRSDEPLAAALRASIEHMGLLNQTPFSEMRSWMGVPLSAKGSVFGILTMSMNEPAYFTEEHARLTAAFANQAAVAIENARLFTEVQRSARESEALFRADAELFRSLDLDAVLQALVDVTVDVLGTEKSMVATWDGTTGHMALRAWRNISDKGLALIRDMYVRNASTLIDPRIIATEDPADAHPEEVPVIEQEGIRSFIQVPVISTGGHPLGFFSVAYTKDHRFTDDEQRLLSALADRAAVAIDNAALYEKAQQVASLEERQRLARELHDSVSQALYGIALGARTARTLLDRDPAQAVEPVDYVLSLAEAGLAEMRALIFELRPESLEKEGLVAAIEKQAGALRARYGLAVNLDDCSEPDVPLATKEALFRISQEALHNIVKHAGASRVEVVLRQNNGAIGLIVTDDGAGFDPAGEFAGHLGLKSMRERAEAAGGKLEVTSQPGAGTRVEASIPA